VVNLFQYLNDLGNKSTYFWLHYRFCVSFAREPWYDDQCIVRSL